MVSVWQKQHEVALKEAERAVALDPNLDVGYAWLGAILGFAGRPQDGIPMVERAMRLNPRYSVWYLSYLGFTYRLAGRCEEAIATFKKALARQPNFPAVYFDLAICYVQLGRLNEAQAAVTEMRRLQHLWSLEGWRQMAPYKDPAVVEQDLAALRQAGWK